jgi:hypothetical protein
MLHFTFCPGAFGQGTAFTYQGQLNDGTNPASGSYDLRFAIYDSLANGNSVGNPLTNSATGVSNGLFTVALDFGPGIFNGADRYLEIGVRTNGGAGFTTLSPRQKLTAAPYAIFAANVGSGSFTGNGAGVTNVNALSLNGIPSTGFWKTNGNTGTTAGVNFLGTSDNQALELKVNGARALRLEPNGANPPNLIGGAANNSVAFGVSGATIGGGHNNTIQSGAGDSIIGGGYFNSIQTSAYQSMVGGGYLNVIQATYSFIGGGQANTIQPSAYESTIGGGQQNMIQTSSFLSTIAGGFNNAVQNNSQGSTISGGFYNTIQTNADASTIAGGAWNTVQYNALQALIGGGASNWVAGNFSLIAGGFSNSAAGSCSLIAGGQNNTIQPLADSATIGGGVANVIVSNAVESTIGGGNGNKVGPGASDSTIGGGANNSVAEFGSVVSGGTGNLISGGADHSTIGGGGGNGILLGSDNSTIGGGQQNVIQSSADHSTVGGGQQNTIQYSAANSTIAGGEDNIVSFGSHATIAGGYHNLAGDGGRLIGYYSSIGGGNLNEASGDYSTVPGGNQNIAGGASSFAAGSHAEAAHAGTFVWADSQSASYFSSSAPNQFCIRAAGGVQLDNSTSQYFGNQTRQMLNLYGIGYGIGVQDYTEYFRTDGDFAWYLGGSHSNNQYDPGGGSILMVLNNGGLAVNGTFVSSSDRNAKEHFESVDTREVLEKVAALPLTKWNYKSDESSRHLGPMAQDFYAAFNVGPDDKHITTVDEGGVALAAIQGLNEKVEAGKARVQKLEAENEELRARLERLEALVENKPRP